MDWLVLTSHSVEVETFAGFVADDENNGLWVGQFLWFPLKCG